MVLPKMTNPHLTISLLSCHPAYLSPKAHTKLSRPNAFSGLRIHTDELNEVIQRFAPATLTIAIVSICVPQKTLKARTKPFCPPSPRPSSSSNLPKLTNHPHPLLDHGLNGLVLSRLHRRHDPSPRAPPRPETKGQGLAPLRGLETVVRACFRGGRV